MAKDNPESQTISELDKEASSARAGRLRDLIAQVKSDPTPRSPHEFTERAAARALKEAEKDKSRGKTSDDC